MQLTVACVLKSGGIYDATWVTRLEASVARHLSIAHRFMCLSDVDVPCERIWWSKIEALKLDGPVLYFDLDTTAVGDLTDIAVAAIRHPFVMLRDFARLGDGLGSGVMAWNATDATAAAFHDIFARDPDGWRERIGGRGDQGFIEDIADLSGITRWQDTVPGQIVSYKIHCRNGIPEKAGIVCLHGPPKFADMPAHDPVRRINGGVNALVRQESPGDCNLRFGKTCREQTNTCSGGRCRD